MGYYVYDIECYKTVHYIRSSRTCRVYYTKYIHIGKDRDKGTNLSQKYNDRDKCSKGKQKYK